MQSQAVDMHAVGKLLFGQPTRYEGKARTLTQGMDLHRFALEEDSTNFDRVHVLIDATGGFAVIEYPGTEKVNVPRKGHMNELLKALMTN